MSAGPDSGHLLHGYRNVTDGKTDRSAVAIYSGLCIASNAYAL